MITPFNKYWPMVFEWSITVILIIGAILTSLNVYPLNIWFLFVSNLGWAIQAMLWSKYSLLIVQTTITVIYIPPLIKSFM
jgi:hypothetical protein